MSSVLGIETSRGLCSAAVLSGGAVLEESRKMERAHNEHILELVDGVVAAAGLAPGELDGVAFGCGPGSFTGIRIAASVAQAIALGADARILPVSSTLALAKSALEGGVPVGAGVIAGIRSKRDAWYLAAYAHERGELRTRQPDGLFTADPDWPEVRDGWLLVGDAPAWWPPQRSHRPDVTASAGLIARMGAAALAAGRGQAPEFGLPVYLSGDSPWRPSAAARNRAP